MNYLRKIPGYRRYSYGAEWLVLRKIHLIALTGTLLPLVAVGIAYLFLGLNSHDFKLLLFFAISLIVLFWTIMTTVGIGCLIVVLMKGPAYVADPYELPDETDDDDISPHLPPYNSH